MNREQLELWQRISKFSFDESDGAFSFTRRLAKENDWTLGYAQRVVTEYRRFAFLAIAAGHAVSPSEKVDQAWHLHILFSESYWQDFCEGTLGHPLHHHPARGGMDEKQKFDDGYERTLASYEKFFLEKPPADIWPIASMRVKEDGKYLRPHTEPSELLRKPRLLEIIVAVACCGGLAMGFLENPSTLALAGRDFVGFYVQLLGSAWISALFLRSRLSEQLHSDTRCADLLDPYEVAFLSSGGMLTVNAALSRMFKRKTLALANEGTAFKIGEPLPKDAHPLESALYQAAAQEDSVSVAKLRATGEPILDCIAARLEELGLRLSTAQRMRAWRIPFMVCLAVILLGCMKLWLGVRQGHPVGGLALTLFIATGIFVACFAAPPTRSRAGCAVLSTLKREHRSPRKLNTADLAAAAPTLLGPGDRLASAVAVI